MNATTLKALHESQAHWKRHWKGKALKGEGVFEQSCALCHVFKISKKIPCLGCPVRNKTGLSYCVGSPWAGACNFWRSRFTKQSAAFRAAARKEWEFLMSLEPKRRKK